MKLIIALLVFAAVTIRADIIPIVQWDIETGRMNPTPYNLSIRRGESVKLQPRFLTYNTPINLTNATIQMRYSLEFNSSSFYAVAGTTLSDTGRIQIAWNDALNPTNNFSAYEIRATSGTNILARAFGYLSFLGGMSGINTGLVALTPLNWATVSQSGGFGGACRNDGFRRIMERLAMGVRRGQR